jgi:hypothetical protein
MCAAQEDVYAELRVGAEGTHGDEKGEFGVLDRVIVLVCPSQRPGELET